MPRSRPPYPQEFREQIVELAKTGRSPSELSREFVQLDVQRIVVRDSRAQLSRHVLGLSSIRVDRVAEMPTEAVLELAAELVEPLL